MWGVCFQLTALYWVTGVTGGSEDWEPGMPSLPGRRVGWVAVTDALNAQVLLQAWPDLLLQDVFWEDFPSCRSSWELTITITPEHRGPFQTMEYTSHSNRRIFLLLWYHPAGKIRDNTSCQGSGTLCCERARSGIF